MNNILEGEIYNSKQFNGTLLNGYLYSVYYAEPTFIYPSVYIMAPYLSVHILNELMNVIHLNCTKFSFFNII